MVEFRLSMPTDEFCRLQATQFYVRGKRRCGYHFEIDLKWKGKLHVRHTIFPSAILIDVQV